MYCHVCEKSFAPNDTRLRDLCHLTGRYRGPVHSNCNLNYKDSYCIPTVFHNLSDYDTHFIIKDIATAYKGRTERGTTRIVESSSDRFLTVIFQSIRYTGLVFCILMILNISVVQFGI